MTVLVAGGTGALGSAVVEELRSAGYEVSLASTDLTTEDGAAAAVSAVDDLSAVVNTVGGFSSGPLVHETDPAEFARMVELNLTTAFLLARAAMPALVERGEGAFVCVSARAALRPFAGAAGYVSGKAALLAFVKTLDAEYRANGVRCNAVLPSVIDTPANREAMPNADHSRWVQPAEIARVIRFLVSGESLPVSGAAVPVYGLA